MKKGSWMIEEGGFKCKGKKTSNLYIQKEKKRQKVLSNVRKLSLLIKKPKKKRFCSLKKRKEREF